MRKTMKKSMGLIMALLMVFGVFAGTTNVFAANNVISNYSQSGWRINGEVDLSNVVSNSGHDVEENGSLYYKGNIGGVVEASDLFKGAYDKYIKDYKGTLYWGKKVENLVMFNRDEKFPTAQYTIDFPDNFNVDFDNIVVTDNTALVSKIEKSYDKINNSVTFTFYLGNWNDYKGFFGLYEKEGTDGHPITINVPYSVEITDSAITNLGTISSEGLCALYKGGNKLFNTQLVNVVAKKIDINVNR
ncbi:hypothetical protein [Peptostreptococcus sp. D1]|uniref:hypothetical protein n=1 Tax=Peptostreptococcus sp. D1 TaxID=72304 RepID=UPI0008F31999|nr:hypothetical protein [Peptostreptococcus sp. D1]SFE96184.1 hypothetical protein SAMN02910278_02170 [Peptostreptococcus sp. D1]